MFKICYGFLLFCAIVFFVQSTKFIYENYKTTTWIETEGVVLDSQVSYYKNRDGGVGVVGSGGNIEVPEYEIVYKYQVNGETLQGYQVAIAGYSSKDRVEELEQKYPKGQIVSVYYDQYEPDSAVLEPGSFMSYLSSMIAWFVSLLFIYGGYLVYFKKDKDN